MRTLNIINIGLMDYEEALQFQYKLVNDRKKNIICDTLVLIEHPHVYTIGLIGNRKNILLSNEKLKRKNIKIVNSERGGDVTYHGPGQIVGYCIVDFKKFSYTINKYVYYLEEVFIILLKQLFSIDSFREKKYPGVWTNQGKVLAIGIRIKDGIMYHGFAFNVNTDLRYFENIIPCGIPGKGVTSLSCITNSYHNIDNIKNLIIRYFSEIFKYNFFNYE